LSLITYSYLRYYTFEKNKEISFFKIIMLIIGISFLIMVIICHTLCVVVNPGNPDQFEILEFPEIYEKSKIIQSSEITGDYSGSYCKKCNIPRPRRAHHCKVCKRCILKMDHHCPWIANCVGYHNQKYFYLFLFYILSGCILAFCGIFNKFWKIKSKIVYYFAIYKFLYDFFLPDTESHSIDTQNTINTVLKITEIDNTTSSDLITNNDKNENPFLDELLIITSTVFIVLVFIGVSVLFGLQTFLILNNITNIEYLKYKPIQSSPYYKPTKLQNFKNLMGSNYFMWPFPITHKSIQNDGYIYVKSFSNIINHTNLTIN
jgi:hypothetical protein